MNTILVVTATLVEARSVLQIFSEANNNTWERMFVGGKTYYRIGELSGVDVYMVQCEMGTSGPGAALLTIHKAIETLSPVAVILVGTAYGINPERQCLGDILISKQLHTYELQKVKMKSKQVISPRGDRVTSSPILLDRFRSGAIDWKGAQLHFGLILSGEKLINDISFRDALCAIEPEAIGGEMEGAGLYAAASDAKVDWIIVKAICDWADGTKGDEYQEQAARNAASFTLHVIMQGGLINFSSLSTTYDKQTYYPPSKPGEVYCVIRKKKIPQISISVNWGGYKHKQVIDLSDYLGLVIHLTHFYYDSIALELITNGDIVRIEQYQENTVPSEWSMVEYKRLSL